jgi:hypothetical protein
MLIYAFVLHLISISPPFITQAAIRAKGWSFLYNGIEPCVLRSLTYGSLRYAFYSPIKRYLSADNEEPSFELKVLSGSIAGCSAAYLCNPADLIKIRMQSSPHHNYTGIIDAFKQVRDNFTSTISLIR